MSTTSETRDAAYDLEVVRGYPIVTLRSSLTDYPLGQVEEIGTKLVSRMNGAKHRGLLVDMTELEYMGSAMVALVVRLWKAVKGDKASTNMVVAVAHDNVREVLELARLTDHWTVVPTREAGLKELGLRGSALEPSSAGAGLGESSSSRGEAILLLVAVLGAAAAVVGAVLVAGDPDSPGLVVACVGGVIGLVGGILAVLGGSTAGKVVGCLAILVSAGSAAAGFALARDVPANLPPAIDRERDGEDVEPVEEVPAGVATEPDDEDEDRSFDEDDA